MKKLVWTLTIIAGMFLAVNLVIAGTISGVVKARGVRTPEDVVIYIEKVKDNKFEPPKEHAILDQRKLTFIPHIMPVLVGTTVDFPNSDNVRHNVFSPSKAKRFDLGTYAAGVTKSVTFDKPGAIVLLCNVHAEMSAYVLALKNPYFAVTNKKGEFAIPNKKAMKAAKIADKYSELKAGKYVLKTWHEKLKTVAKEVTVPDQGEVKVEFALTRGKPTDPYKKKD